MDRLFRIDFYPQDWLIGTGTLTPEECGIYIQIICLIYARRGPVENDPDEIARKLKGTSSRLAKSIILRLIEKEKLFLIDGKLSQKRAEQELNNKRTHLESSARGGRTKAENEADTKKNNNLTSSTPLVSLPTSSPSPSPTESKEIEPSGSTKKKTHTQKKPRLKLEEIKLSMIDDWLAEKRMDGKYLDIDEKSLLEMFTDYCLSSSPNYADYLAAFRKSFNWQNAPKKGNQNATRQPTKTERARAALLKSSEALGYAGQRTSKTADDQFNLSVFSSPEDLREGTGGSGEHKRDVPASPGRLSDGENFLGDGLLPEI